VLLWYSRRTKIPLSDALKILSSGRTLRGSIELDDVLLTWQATFDGHGRITVDIDEQGIDEPIPYDLVPEHLSETPPDDFPGA
jgi:hypothetical protein